MMLVVFCIALAVRPEAASEIVGRPALLARSLIAMYVCAPVIAICVALVLDLDHALRAALVVLALSPVPPVLPRKEVAVRGTASFAIALLTIAAALSIFVLPLGLALVGRLIGRTLDLPIVSIGPILLFSVLLPLGAGMVTRRFAPALAARLMRPLSRVATAILLAAVAAVIIAARRGIVAEAHGISIAAIMLASAACLAVGHLLGGPDPNDRTVLALSTAARHPGVALAVCHALEPDDPTLTAGVLLYFLVGAAISISYTASRRRFAR